jgi:hypothetical protein
VSQLLQAKNEFDGNKKQRAVRGFRQSRSDNFAFYPYVFSVVPVFGEEACGLGWDVDRVQAEVDRFPVNSADAVVAEPRLI